MSSNAVVVPVVAACIVQGEDVLLCKRLVAKELSTLDKWEFPGGRVHVGERLEDAVVREVYEELRLSVKPKGILHAQINTYDSGTYYLVVYFECSLIGRVEYLPDVPIRCVPPQRVVGGEWDVLPGTIETVRKLLERKRLS